MYPTFVLIIELFLYIILIQYPQCSTFLKVYIIFPFSVLEATYLYPFLSQYVHNFSKISFLFRIYNILGNEGSYNS